MRLSALVPLALAAIAVGTPADGARAAAPPAAPRRAIPADRLGGVCGTRPGAAADVIAAHLARPLAVPLPTPHSTDAGNIAVIEDDGGFFFADKGGTIHLDLAGVTQAFYRTHGDDYDALAVFLASGLNDWLGSPNATAAEFGVRNPVSGIGLDPFDIGASFGSPAKLEAILDMNGLQHYPASPDSNFLEGDLTPLDVMIHEFGHRWLAYVYVDSAGTPTPALLGRDDQHWNFFFDSDASVLDGCDWVMTAPDSFRTDSITTGYGRLDLYLMGLMRADEIDSLLVVNDPHDFVPPGNYVPAFPPLDNLGCHGRATWWKMSDIIAVNGPRLPDPSTAPHAFRLGFILVIPNGSPADPGDLAKLEGLRSRLSAAFAYATRGRATMDCTLSSRAGSVVIAHHPLPDTENPPASRPIGCRVTIDQAGIPLTVDPSSVAALWRPAGGGGWTSIPLAPAVPDSFSGTLPGLPGVGDAEYFLVAASDSAGIGAADPAAGPAAPHRYHAGPDLTRPVIVHAPVTAQAAVRLPQTLLARITDNLAVDTAWVEVSVNGGATQTVGTTRAGRDTFVVQVGAGLSDGDRLNYRFVARDAAAAHNLGYSSITGTALAVGHDWLDDFENGDGGFSHSWQWWSYRDAWHLTTEDSWPPGGTAWKCGAWGVEPYPPHLDSYLMSPPIATLQPGTRLEFAHRYDLEQGDATHAWDGARVEGQLGDGTWQILAPVVPYSHGLIHNSSPFVRGAPCWSGNSGGWRTETVDLSPLAPGPTRVRFRMLADDYIGYAGWFVDHVRLLMPGSTGVPASGPAVRVSRPWPNPARGELRLALTLPHAASATWSLYDIAGRRVAELWRGAVPAGDAELRGSLAAVPAGLYFARLTVGSRELARQRVAVVR